MLLVSFIDFLVLNLLFLQSSTCNSDLQNQTSTTSINIVMQEAPKCDRAVKVYLGWPLEIECKFDKTDTIIWYRYYQSTLKKLQLGLNPKTEFYYVDNNILFIPRVRKLFENNTIFECASKSKNKSEKIEVFVTGCGSNPCNSGKCALVNEEHEVPILYCECKAGHGGDFCEIEISNSPTFAVMGVGAVVALFLIVITSLILKKRKKDDIVRKISTIQQPSAKLSLSSKVSGSSKQSSKVVVK